MKGPRGNSALRCFRCLLICSTHEQPHSRAGELIGRHTGRSIRWETGTGKRWMYFGRENWPSSHPRAPAYQGPPWPVVGNLLRRPDRFVWRVSCAVLQGISRARILMLFCAVFAWTHRLRKSLQHMLAILQGKTYYPQISAKLPQDLRRQMSKSWLAKFPTVLPPFLLEWSAAYITSEIGTPDSN